MFGLFSLVAVSCWGDTHSPPPTGLGPLEGQLESPREGQSMEFLRGHWLSKGALEEL